MTDATADARPRNLGLDVVRMFAIAPVLFVHYAAFAFKNSSPLVFIFGGLGVDMFFALSGFLIGRIILRDFAKGLSKHTLGIFYIRRWMRTLPLYWTFFIASAFVTALGLRLDTDWTAWCWVYLGFLQNLAWPPLTNWFEESWSLAIEEWFYLSFPLMVMALPKLAPRTRVLAVAIALAFIPLLLRIAYFRANHDFDLPRRMVVLRLDSIAWGILAVLADTAWPKTIYRWRHLIGVAGLAGFVLAVQIMQGHVAASLFFIQTGLFTLIATSFAALVLWAKHTNWHLLTRLRIAAPIQWMSTRSYALYLCHGSVLKTALFHGIFATSPLKAALVFFPASCLLAEIAHRLIERPVMRLRPVELTGGGSRLHPVSQAIRG